MSLGTSIRRRKLLSLLALAPALAPGSAMALPRMPVQRRPPRPKPLGTFALAVPRPETSPGTVAEIGLFFRPLLNVETPQLRWWRTPCTTRLADEQVTEIELPPMAASFQAPIAIDVEVPADILTWERVPTFSRTMWWRARLNDVGTLRNGDCQPALYLPVTGAGCPSGGRCRIGVRINCEMVDPDSKRRAAYGFVLTIVATPPG